MAKVVAEQAIVITQPWVIWARVLLIGALVGVAYWIVTVLIERYILTPLVCGQALNVTLCANVTGISGNIAGVIVAVGAAFAMIRFPIARPILVAIFSAVLLWDLAAWTSGLWWVEALAWSALLFGIVYTLFSFVTRVTSLVVAIVISIVIIAMLRVMLLI